MTEVTSSTGPDLSTTLYGVLVARGEVPATSYACEYDNPALGAVCSYVGPPVCFADVRHITSIDKAFICGRCLDDVLRGIATLAVGLAKVAPEQTWDSEAGADVKGARNAKLEKWRWAVDPASPLTVGARDRVTAYMKQLNRLTVDYTNPLKAVFPDEPVITSVDYEALSSLPEDGLGL